MVMMVLEKTRLRGNWVMQQLQEVESLRKKLKGSCKTKQLAPESSRSLVNALLLMPQLQKKPVTVHELLWARRTTPLCWLPERCWI